MALISLDNARAPEFSFRDMSYQMRGDTPLIHDDSMTAPVFIRNSVSDWGTNGL